MQSLASLMSVKPSDVGNLDDFAESDEEEANGPGAPEVRARGPQSGGLPVTYGLRLPGPKMSEAFLGSQCWLLWGRASLYMPSDRCSVVLCSSYCPSVVLVLCVVYQS